jgi:hypothetical protein
MEPELQEVEAIEATQIETTEIQGEPTLTITDFNPEEVVLELNGIRIRPGIYPNKNTYKIEVRSGDKWTRLDHIRSLELKIEAGQVPYVKFERYDIPESPRG